MQIRTYGIIVILIKKSLNEWLLYQSVQNYSRIIAKKHFIRRTLSS